MAVIGCTNKGSYHTHLSIAESRVCHGLMPNSGRPIPPVVPQPPARIHMNMNETGVFIPLLEKVPSGYFAWQPDADTPLTFIRISRPNRGNFRGCLKVQSQHGPNLRLDWLLKPNGVVTVWRREIDNVLNGLIVDYRHAAKVYALEKGCCCRCNTDLTDERSRHYGIGPECEKHWEWMIVERDEELGYSFDRRP